MLGAVHVGGVEGEQWVWQPSRLGWPRKCAVDDKDGEERKECVEANLVEALEGVYGVDQTCRAYARSMHIMQKNMLQAWESDQLLLLMQLLAISQEDPYYSARGCLQDWATWMRLI